MFRLLRSLRSPSVFKLELLGFVFSHLDRSLRRILESSRLSPLPIRLLRLEVLLDLLELLLAVGANPLMSLHFFVFVKLRLKLLLDIADDL